MEKQLLSSSKISTKLISYLILFALIWFIFVSILTANLSTLFASTGHMTQLIIQASLFSIVYFLGLILLSKLATFLTFRKFSIEGKEKKTFLQTITTFILVLFIISLVYNYISYANTKSSLEKEAQTIYSDITTFADSATQKQKEYAKKLEQEKDLELQSIDSATSGYILIMCFGSIIGYFLFYYFEKKNLNKTI